MKTEERQRIIESAWKSAEDLIGLAEELETMHRKADADKLRGIVGKIENWCIAARG